MQSTITTSTFDVVAMPAEPNVAALVVRVKATDETAAIERAKRYMERRAVNHITKLAAAGIVNIAHIRYSIDH